MGSAASSSKSVKKEPVEPEVIIPEGPELLFHTEEWFESELFTRWCMPLCMEVVFERFEPLEDEKPKERTFVKIKQIIPQGTAVWNEQKLKPEMSFIAIHIIDYDPTKKSCPQGIKEDLGIHTYFLKREFEDKSDQLIDQEITRLKTAARLPPSLKKEVPQDKKDDSKKKDNKKKTKK